jgi:O-methyltransferase involved in polyketide biosynthesis
MSIPNSVVFVPMDLRKHNLVEQLRSARFKTEAVAFFSWLGVTQYLARETVLATLKLIHSLCPANEVVFDFAVPRDSLDLRNQAAFDTRARRVRAAGEPFEGFFDPGGLTQELENMGFCHIEVLDAEQINTLYFRGRADGLCVGGQIARLMCAWS